MKYEPIYNGNTNEIINDIKKSLLNINKGQIIIDTLDICHLLGKINNLQSKIDKAIELNKNIRKKLLTCSSYEKDKVEDLLFEQLDILKEDK